jgi:hypothetical protein
LYVHQDMIHYILSQTQKDWTHLPLIGNLIYTAKKKITGSIHHVYS